MSCDFYFRQWRQVLVRLENIVHIDQQFQESKPHEQKQCKAAERLSGVLGEYIAIYNDAIECSQQNHQVQKTEYIANIIQAVVGRILELKRQLRKLESSEYQFLNDGLINHKLTTYDIELYEIPSTVERSNSVQAILKDLTLKIEKRKQQEATMKALDVEEVEIAPVDNWWDDKKSDDQSQSSPELYEPPSEETIKKQKYINLIIAHERTRLVTLKNQKNKHRREMWKKELEGKLTPPARLQIREKSAILIQIIVREYFKSKRKKFENNKRDKILGIYINNQVINETKKKKLDEINNFRIELKRRYEKEWANNYEQMKLRYFKSKGEDISEHYRDHIRDWFMNWYKEALFFYDIPHPSVGGAAMIIKEDVPTPENWLQEYQESLEKKKKTKSAEEMKWEKIEAKKNQMRIKKEELMKRKAEEALNRKLKKNPDMHPGFLYPVSHKVGCIITALNTYYEIWNDLDIDEFFDVKQKFVKKIDDENICCDAKIDLINSVDDDMRKELKVLKKALKNDYDNNDEKMPMLEVKKLKPKKKKYKLKATISENVAEKIEDLLMRGFLKEYQKTSFQDFLGDPNFAGDDIRCSAEFATPFCGEMRQIWWERCREVIHGCRKILLVGPTGSGKTKLIHVLASVNDAVLFELNSAALPVEYLSVAYVQQLVATVASCAKALQPAVIYLKHVHLFYGNKVGEEDDMNHTIIERYFIKKLCQRIHKNDNITIIGTCIDPWLTKKKMLKSFPNVLLVPFTGYSLVSQLLRKWVNEHKNIPYDFNVEALAYVLQGYSYSFIQETLNEFMSSERIVKIATYGLLAHEVYEFFLEKDESKVEVDKYMKWYYEKTKTGKREQKALNELKEFNEISQKWKKKKKDRRAVETD